MGREEALCAEGRTHHGKRASTLRRGENPPWEERGSLRRGENPPWEAGELFAPQDASPKVHREAYPGSTPFLLRYTGRHTRVVHPPPKVHREAYTRVTHPQVHRETCTRVNTPSGT